MNKWIILGGLTAAIASFTPVPSMAQGVVVGVPEVGGVQNSASLTAITIGRDIGSAANFVSAKFVEEVAGPSRSSATMVR